MEAGLKEKKKEEEENEKTANERQKGRIRK